MVPSAESEFDAVRKQMNTVTYLKKLQQKQKTVFSFSIFEAVSSEVGWFEPVAPCQHRSIEPGETQAHLDRASVARLLAHVRQPH
jgi:hypothetical protein